jgi:hypothetical protein
MSPLTEPAAVPTGQTFFDHWHALDRTSQKRIRRLVRIGRPVDPSEAPVAVAYAAYQSGRLWQRFFWLWFLPAVVVALGAAVRIHPVVVGVVVGLAAQAILVHLNLRRAGRINARALRSAR